MSASHIDDAHPSRSGRQVDTDIDMTSMTNQLWSMMQLRRRPPSEVSGIDDEENNFRPRALNLRRQSAVSASINEQRNSKKTPTGTENVNVLPLVAAAAEDDYLNGEEAACLAAIYPESSSPFMDNPPEIDFTENPMHVSRKASSGDEMLSPQRPSGSNSTPNDDLIRTLFLSRELFRSSNDEDRSGLFEVIDSLTLELAGVIDALQMNIVEKDQQIALLQQSSSSKESEHLTQLHSLEAAVLEKDQRIATLEDESCRLIQRSADADYEIAVLRAQLAEQVDTISGLSQNVAALQAENTRLLHQESSLEMSLLEADKEKDALKSTVQEKIEK
jgi:hypothetical protein